MILFLLCLYKNVNKVQVQDASHNKFSMDGIFEFESLTSVQYIQFDLNCVKFVIKNKCVTS